MSAPDPLSTPRTGGCLCGAVRFTAAEVPTHAHACHCSICRRVSGAMTISVAVPYAAMTITGAEHLRSYRSSDWAARSFCASCGTSLWFRMTVPDAETADYILSVGCLDDLDGLALTQEIYIDLKPAGYALAGDHQRLTGAEFEASLTHDAENKP